MKKELIPLLLSTILVITTFLIVLSTHYIVDYKFYIGVLLLLNSIIFYFSNKRIYRYSFGATLILGVFGIINFFYLDLNIGFAGFGFNLIFIILTILFLFLDKNIMNKVFPKKLQDDSEISSSPQISETMVKRFEGKYAQRNINELEKIIESNDYTKEAKIAAKNLIKKSQEYTP